MTKLPKFQRWTFTSDFQEENRQIVGQILARNGVTIFNMRCDPSLADKTIDVLRLGFTAELTLSPDE